MNHIFKLGAAALFGLASFASAQSFCQSSHSGESIKVTSNTTGTIGSVGYELWGEQGNQSATFYSDGSMLCEFNGNKDYLCRAGKSYDCTKTYDQLGHLYADFSVNITNTSNINYSYIGIYGWTRNPLVEWYIVDSWGSQYRPGDWVGQTKIGRMTIDGAEYDVYKNNRTSYSIDGDNTNFDQYFSVRVEQRNCGTIDITAHFDAWAKNGLTLGKMYEAKILGEAGNNSGPNATGTFDFVYAKVYTADEVSSSSTAESSSSSATVVAESSSSSPLAINANVELSNGSKTYSVFDMQGKLLGKVESTRDALNATIRASFRNAGAYLVKSGSSVQKINVK